MAGRQKPETWTTGYNRTLLEGWARDGLSIEQIASNMGVDPRTVYRWMKKDEEFCQIIKKNKEVSMRLRTLCISPLLVSGTMKSHIIVTRTPVK